MRLRALAPIPLPPLGDAQIDAAQQRSQFLRRDLAPVLVRRSGRQTASRTCLPPAAWPKRRNRRDPSTGSSPGPCAGSKTQTDGRQRHPGASHRVTSVCRLSKLLRMSHGVRHRYTRTLAGRWITPALEVRSTPSAASRRPRERADDPHLPASARSAPLSPPASSPPARTARDGSRSAAVCARHRRTARSVPPRDRTHGSMSHFFPAVRSFGATARAAPLVCRSRLQNAPRRSLAPVVFM